MKKMLLSSAKPEHIKYLVSGDFSKMKIVFIPTAANTYINKSWMEKDRQVWKDMGFQITNFDLDGKIQAEVKEVIQGADIVFVSGGNTFYLLWKVRQSGFDRLLPEFLDRGGVYVGTSAGAIIVGPTIDPLKYSDDPKDAPGLESYEGLNLVDFVILPHHNQPEFAKEDEEILAHPGYKHLKFILLTDKQSVLVEGDTYKVVD